MTTSLSMFFEPLGSFLSIQAVLSQVKRPFRTRKKRLVTLRTANADPALNESIATGRSMRDAAAVFDTAAWWKAPCNHRLGVAEFFAPEPVATFTSCDSKTVLLMEWHCSGEAYRPWLETTKLPTHFKCCAYHITTPRKTA